MNYLDKRKLEKSKFELPILGFGASPIKISDENITNTSTEKLINFSLKLGVNYFDTAPWYGLGRSEHRIGNALREINRDKFIISTKVGRILDKKKPEIKPLQEYAYWENENDHFQNSLKFYVKFDYSYDGILRSYEDSIQRIGFSKIDMLVVHDLDFFYHGKEKMQFHLDQLDKQNGWKALEQLRSSGEISAIGVGINGDGLIPYFIPKFDVDFFLVAMRYTLLKQKILFEELPLCEKHNVGVVIGSPYQSGILAAGLSGVSPTYNYRQPSNEVINKIETIEKVCKDFDVNIGAVSIQFPLHHPAVLSVIPGMINEDQVKDNIENLSQTIPNELWQELKKKSIIEMDSPIGDL